MTLGGVYALVAYAGMLQIPLMGLVFQVRDLEEAVGALRRIAMLFGERSTVVDGPEPLAPTGTAIDLVVEGVGFGYRPGEYALRGVSLRLPPGRRLAVVGRTGSGKSTLAKLLFRFADPTDGRILVDGRDLRELTLCSLRARVGLVTQDVQVFHASVRDNVTLFDPAVPDPTVERVVRQVGLGSWLDALPGGLDTVVGAGAAGLSAGQAQLLAFARVLVADPGLVVLDEATSRLDPASRRQFEEALGALLAGRTAVIIAHQPDIVREVDDVLVLADGRVLEHGPRAALTNDRESAFSRLLRSGEALG